VHGARVVHAHHVVALAQCSDHLAAGPRADDVGGALARRNGGGPVVAFEEPETSTRDAKLLHYKYSKSTTNDAALEL